MQLCRSGSDSGRQPFDDHINRGELIQHAELVRRGALPREGSLAWDFPPYDTIEELEKAAGYDDGSPIERHGIAHAAAIERAREQWKADDKALWTKYGGDSEEESESEENNEDDKTLEDKEKTEQEKQTEIERLNATTARQIKETIENARREIGTATSEQPSTAVNGVFRSPDRTLTFLAL